MVVHVYSLIEEEIVGDLIMNDEDRLRIVFATEGTYNSYDLEIRTLYIVQASTVAMLRWSTNHVLISLKIWHTDRLHAVITSGDN